MRNALGLDGIVHLIGFRNNVPQLLPDLDVFLFTSKTEGLGSSILDAMASGIPVVTTNAGGISEIVVHEKNALVANVGDATQLAHHVLHVLHNPELRHLLVAGALRTAQNFSVRQMARQTASHYRELAKGLG
jgi:glycosyltransferase involved in cell wall biosynthesis